MKKLPGYYTMLLISAALSIGAIASACYATIRKPMPEVWCYDPVWKQGDEIATQFAVCETKDGEKVQVVIID